MIDDDQPLGVCLHCGTSARGAPLSRLDDCPSCVDSKWVEIASERAAIRALVGAVKSLGGYALTGDAAPDNGEKYMIEAPSFSALVSIASAVADCYDLDLEEGTP